MKRIVATVKRKLAQKSDKLDTRQMRFLQCSESELSNDTSIDRETLEVFLELRRNGYARIGNNIPRDLCDAVVEDFNRYCATTPDAKRYKDEKGLHSRLALFHYKSENAMKIGTWERTCRIVKAAFMSDFTIVGSLFFEKGSTQDVHRDTPAFFTNPLNHFFGVWNALEDIKPGSGELCYFRGGHKVLPDAELYGNGSICIDNYFSAVKQACIDAGLELEQFHAKKGDTLIWLPQLPHGGSRREDEASTRRSMVFHYVPRGVPLHGVREFFDSSRPLNVKENYAVRVRNGVRMIDMGETRFYHNYKEGNFEEG